MSEYIKKATNSFKYNKINTTNQGSSSEWTTEGGREKKGEKKVSPKPAATPWIATCDGSRLRRQGRERRGNQSRNLITRR